LIHVLPDRFQRIRYYGFLSNRYRQQKLAQCRQLLGTPATLDTNAAASERSEDYRDLYERLTGISLRQCPVCHQGCMLEIESVPAVPAFMDSS
ncbi:MAG: transposase, partial [Chloroflexi bacterium]|nr:transposase [Chloroflexota bacterium]